ncbi:type II secretion system F family protein [Candidatus Woesearchaeota archaeon]|nr:type II secretion system F family protein [Candidatus Woesearchaeota archaeon]
MKQRKESEGSGKRHARVKELFGRHLFRKRASLGKADGDLLRLEKKQEERRQRQEALSTKRLLQQRRQKQKQERKRLKNRQLLRKYLDKAGYDDVDESNLTKHLFRIIIAVCLLFSLVSLIVASVNGVGVRRPIIFLTGVWTGIFAGLFVLAWVLLYIFLDVRIFNRTLELEEVLPDFLQLVSANISAGMPVDRALWFAVRPRFGILAKEIEDVAKSTISGEDLSSALQRFTRRYDSKVLRRSINLLLEGMDSGGEMAGLLNKIALNIQETRILKKEMAANVMTYAIFIGFATVVAAPVLFGLSGQLLVIIQKIMGLLAVEGGTGGAGFFTLSLEGDSITVGDFRIFSVATLFVTSLFSAFIISIIRKGTVKEGARFIPVFVLATLALYFVASWILSVLLGGLVAL